MPQAVRNLIMIANIKFLGGNCGFTSIQEKDNNVILQFKDSTKVDLGILSKLMDKYKRKLLFTASNTPYITFKVTDIKRENLLSNIKILLQDINQLKCG
jgi:transcription-repair coupling factor (superfamily II helicase)